MPTWIAVSLSTAASTAIAASPAFSVSKRGTYTSTTGIATSLAGSFVTSANLTPVRFVIGQNSVNIASGGTVLTLTADKKVKLTTNPSFVSNVGMVGSGTWKWTTPTTLTLSGNAKATTTRGTANTPWSSTVKFPSAGKAIFKLTAEGTINGSALKVEINATATK